MTPQPLNFGLVGVAGYIAPRHIQAIQDTNNRLVVALDPNDSVGLLDKYALDTQFFTETERFDRFLEKRKRGQPEDRIHYLSICSPNYLHDAHCRMALRVGAHAICEKPLVINPWNLAPLQELEAETGCRINTILQLRVHPALIELRERLLAERSSHQRHKVTLTYCTARGNWYRQSWKGNEDKSGGIASNIGIHFFDLLIWLFGDVTHKQVHLSEPNRMAGAIEMEYAHVTWFLSIDGSDLPFPAEPGKRTTYRSITIDGQEIEFTEQFTSLHTRVYERTLAGQGFGIADILPATQLVYDIRHTPIVPGDAVHPFLKR